MVGPQDGQGSISPLILLLYRMAMDSWRVPVDERQTWEDKIADRMRTIAKIWFFTFSHPK